MVQFRAATPRAVRWEVLHEDLGVALPPDFRALAEAYPKLFFDEFLLVNLPEPGEELSFAASVRASAEIVRLLSDAGMAKGYVPFPEPGGLLEWGSSDCGDSFYWRTWSKSPSDWSIVVSGRNDDWSEYAIGVVDFLAAVFRKDFTIPGMPYGFPSWDSDVIAH
jgi:hypothetical protein